MTSSRRNQWWNVVGKENQKSIIYWTHMCGGIQLSVKDGECCPHCGISEEEYGRLKSKRSEGRVSST